MAAVLAEVPPPGPLQHQSGAGVGAGRTRRVVLVECRHTLASDDDGPPELPQGQTSSPRIRLGCGTNAGDTGGGGGGSKAEKSEVKPAEECPKQVPESSWADDDVCPSKAAAELQAKRLYAALGNTTDNERDAYRRNRTEQTRLEMALDHIGLQRNVAKKTLQREMKVMKTKSSRIEERARLVRDGSVASSYPRYPYGGARTMDDGDTLPTIGAGAPSGGGGRLTATMTTPGSRRSGARSITFMSEVSGKPTTGAAASAIVQTDNDHRSNTAIPKQSTLGPATANRSGIRSNATRYIDTSTFAASPREVVTQSAVQSGGGGAGWSTAKARLGRPRGGERLYHRTQEAYQPADTSRSRTALIQQLHHQQQPRSSTAKVGSKQKPLVAIVSSSTSFIAQKRHTHSWSHDAASRSLDADIDAVLNARADGGGGGGGADIHDASVPGGSSFASGNRNPGGFGLRQPANFSINYRPSVHPDTELDDDLLIGVPEEEDEEVFVDNPHASIDALRSLTSFSHRPAIDRVATPSSNAFRAEGGAGRRANLRTALSSKSAPQATMSLTRDMLHSRGGRRESRDPAIMHGFMLQKALLREKTNMRGMEDKLEVFYDKLKGTTAKGKRPESRPNHWDVRGLDEKLMFY